MSNSLRNSFAVTNSLTVGWTSSVALAFIIVTVGVVAKIGFVLTG